MNDALLMRLQKLDALRAIDVEFGLLTGRMHEAGSATPSSTGNIALVAAAASQAIAQGHSCLPLTKLGDVLAAASGEASLPRLPDAEDLRRCVADSPMVGSISAQASTPLVTDGERIWLRRYHDYERRVARSLVARAQSQRCADPADIVRARLARWFPAGHEPDWQAVAVALGLRARLTIISGGPGTGKTTTVLWLLAALLESALERGQPLPRVRLAAPTGKAAARLGESIRERKPSIDCSDTLRDAIREDQASTLHRLLGYRPNAGFRHTRANPVAADVVVVDEASMIDLPLMAHLLDALHEDTALILLGDVGQLASVEAGHVLAALGTSDVDGNSYRAATAGWLVEVTGFSLQAAGRLESDATRPALADAFVELRTSHRFGIDSGIGQLAATIRAGDAEGVLRVLRMDLRDVAWQPLDQDGVARILHDDWLAHAREIGAATDAAAALEIASRFRVLTALRRGPFGSVAINREIEARLGNGDAWYHGRLVMIVANDYRHKLFNGDIGVAWRSDDGHVEVVFAGDTAGLRTFAPYTLPAHEAAFAMTVHKSQGSEFDAVAVVLPDKSSRVLGRELLYTAVTRARHRVAVHGNEEIVRDAVMRRIERWSGLPERLREAREDIG